MIGIASDAKRSALQETRTFATCLLLLAGFGLTAGMAQAQAPQQAWDQEKVTALAAQLAEAVREVRSATRAEPSMNEPGQVNQRAAQQYLQTLKTLERATGQLARRLANGQDHDGTVSTARRIGMLLRDAQEQAAKLDIPLSTRERIDPAMALIDQIRPYYKPDEAADARKTGKESAKPAPPSSK